MDCMRPSSMHTLSSHTLVAINFIRISSVLYASGVKINSHHDVSKSIFLVSIALG